MAPTDKRSPPRRRREPPARDVLDLTDAIYAAASEPALWRSFLGRLAGRLGAVSASISRRDDAATMEPEVDLSSVGGTPIPIGRVARRANGHSAAPVVETGFADLDGAPSTDGVRRDAGVGRNRSGRRDRIPFLRSVLVQDPGATITLTMCRRAGQAAFSPGEVALCAALVPHMRRALELHRRLEAVESRLKASDAATDHAGVGVIVLDAQGGVVRLNELAREMVDEGDGVLVRQERLHASSPGDAPLLRQLIARVCSAAGSLEPRSSARIGGVRAWEVLQIARKQRRPLVAAATPIASHGPTVGDGAPAALLFLADSSRRLQLPARLLTRLYGLTATEARVALALLRDGQLTDVARNLGVTMNTLRTHLKRIFEKTEVASQRGLVQLLMTGPASLRLREDDGHAQAGAPQGAALPVTVNGSR